jgi:hypothetical protein
MSLEILPDELILHIWGFVETNKDMVALVSTYRRFRNLGKKFGYIKSIKFGMHTNFMNFIELYRGRNDFLQRLTMENINKPMPWIPTAWPKEMIFNRCFMGSKLADPPPSPTETLIVRDLFRHKHRHTLRINWCKLKKLRVLDIYVPDVDFTGLDECKELEVIRIDLDNKRRLLPSFLSHMPKLHTIAVTCQADKAMHFVSDKLTICFVPKQQDFTSKSQIVPKRHLKVDSGYFNIQCLNITNLSMS